MATASDSERLRSATARDEVTGPLILSICPILTYVSRGAGIDDTGNYQLTGPDGGEIAMVEGRLEQDRLLLETPFLRRLRAEGALMGRRQSILDVLRLRFDPPISVYQQLERYLETITDEA